MKFERAALLESQARGGFPLRPFIPKRHRPGDLGTWSGHLAFANDLILEERPSIIVELGTHYGESYFGFCQTVQENALPTVCYAVDHWLGEAHAGFYSEDVFQEVSQYNEIHYKSFSYLLRSDFDQAAQSFSQQTIDLLHIDGLHTYEAVKHDFETWLPKVKPGGVILLHDIAVRHTDFGVWRWWEELQTQYAATFAFYHWWGLGVLRKPGDTETAHPFLDVLFSGSPEAKEGIRRQYATYASALEHRLGSGAKSGPTIQQGFGRIRVQVFAPSSKGYNEEDSSIQNIEPGGWVRLEFEFPEFPVGQWRIDPADRPCLIELRSISIRTADDSNRLVWNSDNVDALRSLQIGGDLLLLPNTNKCLLFSFGNDPVMVLPHIETPNTGMRLELLLRIENRFDGLVDAIQETGRAIADLQESGACKIGELQTELKQSLSERILAAAQLTQATTERNQLRADLRQAERFIEILRTKASHEEQAEVYQAQVQQLEQHSQSLRSALEHERSVNSALLNSKSWKITKPLRRLMSVLGKNA